MGRYIAALFTPTGRLPKDIYLMASIPLAMLIAVAHRHLCALEDPYGLTMAGLIVLMWMNYCIMSGRIQDCGYPGAVYLFPIFLFNIWYLLSLYDPSIDEMSLDADGEEIQSGFMNLMCLIRSLSSKVVAVLWAYCVIGEPSQAENAFGLPWGVKRRSALGRDRASQKPAVSPVSCDACRTIGPNQTGLLRPRHHALRFPVPRQGSAAARRVLNRM